MWHGTGPRSCGAGALTDERAFLVLGLCAVNSWRFYLGKAAGYAQGPNGGGGVGLGEARRGWASDSGMC